MPSLDQVMQMIGNFVGPGTLFIATFTVLSFKFLKADPVTRKTPTEQALLTTQFFQAINSSPFLDSGATSANFMN